MKQKFFVCQCNSLQHLFVVTPAEDEIYLEVHLSPLPFWKRVRNAVRYVFGRRSKYGDFEEIILSPSQALDLGDTLIEWAELESGKVFEPNDVH